MCLNYFFYLFPKISSSKMLFSSCYFLMLLNDIPIHESWKPLSYPSVSLSKYSFILFPLSIPTVNIINRLWLPLLRCLCHQQYNWLVSLSSVLHQTYTFSKKTLFFFQLLKSSCPVGSEKETELKNLAWFIRLFRTWPIVSHQPFFPVFFLPYQLWHISTPKTTIHYYSKVYISFSPAWLHMLYLLPAKCFFHCSF